MEADGAGKKRRTKKCDKTIATELPRKQHKIRNGTSSAPPVGDEGADVMTDTRTKLGREGEGDESPLARRGKTLVKTPRKKLASSRFRLCGQSVSKFAFVTTAGCDGPCANNVVQQAAPCQGER